MPPSLTHTQLESLPITPPPVARELARSYIRRLATANATTPTLLLRLLADRAGAVPDSQLEKSSKRGKISDLFLNDPALARLSQLSGYSAETLACTLHRHGEPDQLGHQKPEFAMVPIAPVTWNDNSKPVAACPHCTASRGIHDPVTIFLADDDPACQRHHLWLADQPGGRPINLDQLPGFAAALTQHHRLRRQHPENAQVAYRQARNIWRSYRRDCIRDPLNRVDLINRFADRAKLAAPQAPNTVTVLARYPENVTLTGMIISRHWLQAAVTPYERASPHGPTTDRQRPDFLDFLHELARRINHPEPTALAKGTSSLGNWARARWPIYYNRRTVWPR